MAEAQGRLGADGASLPDLAAEIGDIRREIDARQADAARFDRFLKGAIAVQDRFAPAGIQEANSAGPRKHSGSSAS